MDAERSAAGPGEARTAEMQHHHSINFSIGRDSRDAHPKNHEAESFDEFERIVLKEPHPPRKGMRYVAAGFSDGHRSKESTQARAWVPFDFDAIADGETWAALYLFLSRWRGFAYTTASHTPEKPRCRAILAASRPMDRSECIRVATAIQRRIEAHLGAGAVTFDASVYRPEQPCFTPTVGGEIVRWLDGDPVDVDELLQEAPEVQDRRTQSNQDDGAEIPEGQRNNFLLSLAGTMRRRGMTQGEILAALQTVNEARCTPPLPLAEVEQIARSVSRYAAEEDFHQGAAEFGDKFRERAKQQAEAAADRYCVPELKPLTLESIREAKLTPRVIADGYLWADLAVLAAPGSTGKTTTVLCEAVNLALGRPIWGRRVPEPASTVFVTAEDPDERLQARLCKVMEGMQLNEYDMSRALSRIKIWDVTGDTLRLAEIGRGGNIELTPLADSIVTAFQGQRVGVINFDPTVSFGPGERMVNDAEQSLVTAARRIIKGLDCCVRLIHHTGQAAAMNKALDQYATRGGSALPDGARMVAIMQPEPNPDGIALDHGETCIRVALPKCSYGPPQGQFFIIRSGWSFRHHSLPTEAQRAEEVARQTEDDVRALVEFIADEIRAGRRYGKSDIEQQHAMGWARARTREAVSIALTRGLLATERFKPDGGPGQPRVVFSPSHPAKYSETTTVGHPFSADSNSLNNSPPPTERMNGGEVLPPILCPSLILRREPSAKYGEHGEVFTPAHADDYAEGAL